MRLKLYIALSFLSLILVACSKIETLEQHTNNIDLNTQTLNWGINRLVNSTCANHYSNRLGEPAIITVGLNEETKKIDVTWYNLIQVENCSDLQNPDCYETDFPKNRALTDEEVANLEQMLNDVPEFSLVEKKCSEQPCITENVMFDSLTDEPAFEGFLFADNCDMGGAEYARKVELAFAFVKNLVP